MSGVSNNSDLISDFEWDHSGVGLAEVVKSLMSYVSEGDVGRHQKFDNFLFWFAVLTGVDSSPHVVGGAGSRLDILSDHLSARQTNLVNFYFPSPLLLEGSEIFRKIRAHVSE